MASTPQFNALLQTISSKHFEKLIFRDTSPRKILVYANDQLFHSFAERLYKLGATKPLSIVLKFSPEQEVGDGAPDVRRIWPLFCRVGIIVKEYGGGRGYGH